MLTTRYLWKRFVDTVCMQAHGTQHSPLRVYSSRFVVDLTPEQLEVVMYVGNIPRVGIAKVLK